MRFRSWLVIAVVYVVFAPIAFSRSLVGQYPFVVPARGQDWRLREPLLASSIFVRTLSGLRKMTHRKRTAMGMDLTDYLWSKAHEKHRAMMLQRMMKNGRR